VREGERVLVGERLLREIREIGKNLWGFLGLQKFYREAGTSLSDLNVRLRSLCKRPPPKT